MDYSEGYAGMSYAPADFLDADDTRPIEISMDPTGQGVTAPYSLLVGNVQIRHMSEIKEKSSAPVIIQGNWKKKFREFMGQKNEDLLKFLRKPVAQHPVLGQAEQFMKRFGRTDFQANHPSLQGALLDASGVQIQTILEEELQTIGPSTPTQIIEQIRWLYDSYRKAGEELNRCEKNLKLRLDVLDKAYSKVTGFMDLPVNEDTTKLSESVQVYLTTLFEENNIEPAYHEMIETYRRFVGLKELIQFFRFLDLVDKEPLCSICLQEPVGYTLSPCGHTFCPTCVKRQMTSCYMCRATIRERIRIFFG